MALNFNNDEEIFGIKVDDKAKYYLQETRRWTKFVGIIFAISMVLICLLMTFMFTIYLPQYMQTPVPNSGAILMVMLLLTAGINFFPIFALLKFGSNINKALKANSQEHFLTALKYLKNMFMYIGIVTIVVILLYGISFAISAMALRGAAQ